MFSIAMKSWSESQCICNKVIKNSSVKMQILCTFRCCTLSYLFLHWNDINIFSWHHSIFLFPDWRQSSIRRSSHCPWAPLNQLSLLRKLSCSNNLLNGKWTIFFLIYIWYIDICLQVKYQALSNLNILIGKYQKLFSGMGKSYTRIAKFRLMVRRFTVTYLHIMQSSSFI